MKTKNEILKKTIAPPSKEEIRKGMKKILSEQLERRKFLRFTTQKENLVKLSKNSPSCN
jgi:hypothetical protein